MTNHYGVFWDYEGRDEDMRSTVAAPSPDAAALKVARSHFVGNTMSRGEQHDAAREDLVVALVPDRWRFRVCLTAPYGVVVRAEHVQCLEVIS